MVGETAELELHSTRLGLQLTRHWPLVVLQVTVSLRFDVSKVAGVFPNVADMEECLSLRVANPLARLELQAVLQVILSPCFDVSMVFRTWPDVSEETKMVELRLESLGVGCQLKALEFQVAWQSNHCFVSLWDGFCDEGFCLADCLLAWAV